MRNKIPDYCLTLFAKIRYRLLYTILLVSILQPAIAQQPMTVTGIVKDGTDVIPGVSVKVKGSTVATSTDENGKFTIKVADNSTLVFTSLAYNQKEVLLSGQNTLTIILIPSQTELESVVVVGYGTQKKVNLSGSVATVSGATLNKRVATSPSQLLQGQLSGVSVTQGSGEAGNENTNITVRGFGTYSGAGSAPLIIVDGIPGSLNNLNPENIESVNVLKDAASAAIYGSRAANGVILVTTKQGKAGKSQVTYSYNLGVTSATSLPEFIYDSPTYMRLFNQAAVNSGDPRRFTQAQIDAYTNPANPEQYPSFNWLEAVFKTANVQTHNLTLSGGSEKTTYNIGLGYVDQPDVMYKYSYKKFNLQLNLNSKVNDFITVGTNLTVNYGRRLFSRNGSEDQFLSTLAQSPLYGPYMPDGSGRYVHRAYAFQGGNKNPIAEAETAQASNDAYYVQGNVFADIKLLKGLQWRTTLGTNFNFSKNYEFKPIVQLYYTQETTLAPTLDVGGKGLLVTDNNNVQPVGFSQLTYAKSFGDHNLNILAGTQMEYYKEQRLSGGRLDFINNDITELDAGNAGSSSNTGFTNEWSLASYYGRLNYDFKGKYLLELNARYDGSSRFVEDQRWGFFPSASAAYRISQEKFFEKLLPVVSDLKIRASYGVLGNQNIGNYPYQSTYKSGFPYPIGGTLVDGVKQSNLVQRDITWETTTSANLGLDAAFLKNKLSLSVDYYYRKTKDILDNANLPIYSGITAPIINYGQLRNKGLDFTVGYKNNAGEFKYSVQGILQVNDNKITQFPATQISARNIRQEGLPFDSYYLYEYDGIYQSAAEVAAAPRHDVNGGTPQPGWLKFKDLNGDGVINGSDRKVFDGVFPKFDYSFTTNLEYKNFDLTVFFYGSQGRKLYTNQWGVEPFRQDSPPPVEWQNAWTQENPSTTLPKIYISGLNGPIYQNIGAASSYYLKDASFLRIKNVQLGYNVPTTLTKKFFIQSIRVYFAGDNLFLFTKFPGLDPERAVNAGSDRYVTHPQNKVYNFGIRVTL